MAKIDDDELLLKHHGKLMNLKIALDELLTLENQRREWSEAAFAAKTRKPHIRIYVNAGKAANPFAIPVPPSFIAQGMDILNARVTATQSSVREIIRELTAEPRPRKTTRSRT